MMQVSKWSMFLTFVLTMLFGLLLLLVPDALLKTINYLIVSIFFVIGIIEIISFFINKNYKNAIYNNLIIGVICVWISLFVYVYYSSLIIILPVFLSLYAFIMGAVTLIKYFNNKKIIHIVISVISLIMGILLLFKPFLTLTVYFQLSGIYLIITSIMFFIEWKKIK